MRITLVIVLFTWAARAQNVDQKTRQQVDELFPTPNPNEYFNGFEEVTKAEDGGSIGALQKCGEGSSKDSQICVPYHMCDGRTRTVVQTGVTDGFGIIDIRFGENACEHPLDVCCQIPAGGLDPKLPLPTRDTSSTPQPPPTSPLPNTGVPQIDLPVTQPTVRSYCGIRNPDGIDFKISGQKANEAEYGEFPWMVAIISKNEVNSERPLLCGGSLITPNVVLTGAHCVNKFDTNSIKIRAGEWDTQTTRERLPYQERDVANIIIHNDFNPNNLFNDFALLILTSAVTRADNVGTICLPTQGQTISSNECYVSGWGKKFFGKQGQFQAILKKIDLPTVPQAQCESLLKKTRLGENFLLHRSFMCAGGIEGKDACTGDGGSPLVCPDPMTPGRYVQAGIVGWGIGCGESNVPGVYADVAKFRSWIDGQMERLNIDTAPYNL